MTKKEKLDKSTTFYLFGLLTGFYENINSQTDYFLKKKPEQLKKYVDR